MSDQYQPYPEESARSERDGSNQVHEQPPSIRTAVLLMRAGAAVSLIGLVVTLFTLDTLKDEVRAQLGASDASFSSADLDTAFNAAVVFAIVFGLIGVGLWLWMAWANGKGRKWARVVATVFGVINVLSFIFVITAGSATTPSLIVSVLSVLVGVAALFYLYRPDASQFYSAAPSR